MELLDLVVSLTASRWTPVVVAVSAALFWLCPYFVTYRSLRHIPGPFPAHFTNFWLLSVCRRGNRFQVMDELHKKLGTVVRIQPNHVSIADDDAIQVIYGHGNGFLKS